MLAHFYTIILLLFMTTVYVKGNNKSKVGADIMYFTLSLPNKTIPKLHTTYGLTSIYKNFTEVL